MKIFNAVTIIDNAIIFPISTHKYFEIELHREGGSKFFNFSIGWSTRTDHAGPRFTLEFYKLFSLSIRVYDHRHWNYEENRYCLDNEF